MAWSDAARAAAAETRRRNKKNKLSSKKRIRVKDGKYNWDDNGQRGIGPTGKIRTQRMMRLIRSL